VALTRVASGLWKEPKPRLDRPVRQRRILEAQHAPRVSPTRQACSFLICLPRVVLIVTEDEGRDDKANLDQSPRYWPSKTVQEWRAYHRAYYRDHAERRRAQARHSHLRKVLRQAFGTAIPRSLRRPFLRDSMIQ
jgi:hypothetical protein